MGIRFYCPNGHRLNVKSFLAGKRGICPHCGAKVEIPVADSAGQDDDTESSESQQTVAPIVVSPISQVNVASSAATQKTLDGFDETPDAVWYVRPPGGGQFGPASGADFRGWITEGRVSSDSLVWRDGWPDWRAAGEVFDGLTVARSANAGTDERPSASTAIGVPESIVANPSDAENQILINHDSPTQTALRRRKSSSASGGMIVLLVLACLVSAAALIYVVSVLN